MGAPRLLFCVGATKAGTSWLHEYLAAHPEVFLRSVKELHYFDAIEFDRRKAQIAELDAQVTRFAERLGQVGAGKRRDLERKIADRQALAALLAAPEAAEAYLGYLTEGRGSQPLVADVTPAYSLLPAARLRAMADLVPDVRFVYLMRDPVLRLWSHVRMMAKRRGAADEGRAAAILDRTLSGAETEIVRRSDYRGALERLGEAVDPARLLVMFYEELMTLPGVRRLCSFLGIGLAEPNFGRRVHEGPALAMAPAQAQRAREWLAPQYDYVAERMGHVPAAWTAARAGV